jgi:hypothetical protein
MNDRRTKEQHAEDVRSTRSVRKLVEELHRDVDAIISRRADYTPTRAEEFLASEVFRIFKLKWGEDAARKYFSSIQFCPWPKRLIQYRRELNLAQAYGAAGKPNGKSRNSGAVYSSQAAFAKAAAKWNENRRLPSKARMGSGTTDENNMLRDLKRMLKKKKFQDIVEHWYAAAEGHFRGI